MVAANNTKRHQQQRTISVGGSRLRQLHKYLDKGIVPQTGYAN
jgi:hypothetical protein